MIDLHCHLLPGVDDGAGSLAQSLEMARMAVDDGITITACTPHIDPGLFNNAGPAIRIAVAALADALTEAGINLHLVAGADVHIAPDLVAGLRSGRVLTIADSRYLLFEPPHSLPPPRIEDTAFGLLAEGYVPILTHPERLNWIETHYRTIEKLAAGGVWMQITAGSLTGRFGRRARYWAERLLDEEMVQLLCTDAHDPERRPPRLAEAAEIVAGRIGGETAERLVWTHPSAVLRNLAPDVALGAGAVRVGGTPGRGHTLASVSG